MQYLKLNDVQRKDLMHSLAGMKDFLRETFESLTAAEACAPGPGNSFSPVEQVWHLADLEREGFGSRIRRLRSETNPLLEDFDGDRIARERNYTALSLWDGIAAFEEARSANLSAFRMLPPEAWARHGRQEGVGEVSLCDMPGFIHQHDLAHVEEILAWKTHKASGEKV